MGFLFPFRLHVDALETIWHGQRTVLATCVTNRNGYMMQEARVKWRYCFNQKIAEPSLRRVTHRVAFGNSLRPTISTRGLRCKKDETSGLIVVSFDVRRRRVVASSETRQEVPFSVPRHLRL